MGSKWNNGTRDIGGILRKTNQHPATVAAASLADDEKRLGELLVFGYACKIFRDDDKARFIDQGKHLIPWMGDESLKIDRYDVRAALPDISQYEPPPGGYTNRLEYLTPAEQRAEQLCEEERYFSLYNNDEEEQMYQEEELKRLHREGASSYGQVQFDYNSANNTQESKKVIDEKADEPDEVYTPPINLNVPPDIATPETMKQHAIIERTAKFISTQGPQMEILIKTKQSNNPQFEFLTQSSKFFPYYKFILNAFKNGTYPDQSATIQTTETTSTTQPKESIVQPESTNAQVAAPQPIFVHPATITIPTIRYKPSADCAYTQLISKIKGVPIPEEPPEDPPRSDVVIESAPSLYYSSYYTASHIDPEQYYSVEPNGMPVQPAQEEPTPAVEPEESQVEVKKISSGLMLAQCYGSDTEDETDADENKSAYVIPENYPIPPDSLQHIIDKTAIYVAKNGKTFEEILCTKQDERFTFLDPSNEFYPYYLQKVTSLNSNYVPTSNGHGKPKLMTPVSFSIKSKDDSAVPINPALLQETSDDDDPENKSKAATYPNHAANSADKSMPATPSPNAIIAAATAARISAAIAKANAAKTGTPLNEARSRFDIDNTGSVVNRANAAAAAVTANANKSEATQQKELKRAEEKVKDRLAQIAREKLGLISKEKQLQLERKKRAMAFLNQIKTTSTSPPNSTTPPLNNSSRGTERTSDDDGSNSDTSSVHSIPISSYQNDDDDGNEDEKDDNRSRSIDRLTPPPIENVCPKIDDPNYTQIIDDDDDDDDVRIIENDDENNMNNNHQRHHKSSSHRSSRKRERSKRHRSRSRSAKGGDDGGGGGGESTSRHRHKKKKSKHSKKKSKKRSRSRSPSEVKTSTSREKKRAKKSDTPPTKSRKSSKKKKRRERVDS